MGFDTYLDVGNRTALMWRKSTSSMPRLLFRHHQTLTASVESPNNPMHKFEVEYRATAADVLDTLRDGGLGWDSSVATYSTVRQGLVAESMLYVADRFAPGLSRGAAGVVPAERVPASDGVVRVEPQWDAAAWDKKLAAFQAQPPSDDLKALGELLALQWLDDDLEEVVIFKDMVYDGPISASTSFIFEIMDAAKARDLDQYAVARAAESFALLYTDAPLLAWPLLVCVLLYHLPPETPVSYVLTEHAHQLEVSSDEGAKEYLDNYWLSSAEGLVSQAGILGRLFSVLASFDSKLGREFWFARAAEALGRLDAVNADKEQYSTKARGDVLETLVDALLRTEEPELSVLQKNFRTSEEEIDVVLTNGLTHPFWTAQSSAYMFVECKNWGSPVGVKELRVFESKMRDRGAVCKIGIFVAMGGFAETALERLKVPQRDLGVIFAVTGDDLRELVTKKTRLTEWLRTEGAIRALGK